MLHRKWNTCWHLPREHIKKRQKHLTRTNDISLLSIKLYFNSLYSCVIYYCPWFWNFFFIFSSFSIQCTFVPFPAYFSSQYISLRVLISWGQLKISHGTLKYRPGILLYITLRNIYEFLTLCNRQNSFEAEVAGRLVLTVNDNNLKPLLSW